MTRPARHPISRASCTHRPNITYTVHVTNLHLEQGDLHLYKAYTQDRHTLPQDFTKSKEDQRRSC